MREKIEKNDDEKEYVRRTLTYDKSKNWKTTELNEREREGEGDREGERYTP